MKKRQSDHIVEWRYTTPERTDVRATMDRYVAETREAEAAGAQRVLRIPLIQRNNP